MWGGEGWKSATDCNMIWLQRRKLKRGISINNNEENPSEREIERRPHGEKKRRKRIITQTIHSINFYSYYVLGMDFRLAACEVRCGFWVYSRRQWQMIFVKLLLIYFRFIISSAKLAHLFGWIVCSTDGWHWQNESKDQSNSNWFFIRRNYFDNSLDWVLTLIKVRTPYVSEWWNGEMERAREFNDALWSFIITLSSSRWWLELLVYLNEENCTL